MDRARLGGRLVPLSSLPLWRLASFFFPTCLWRQLTAKVAVWMAGVFVLAALVSVDGRAAVPDRPDGERILTYDAAITVHPDSSVTVTESLRVQAAGEQIRHGIYRDIPTVYRDRQGNRVRSGLRLLRVERDGHPEPYETESLSNGIRIRVGDPDVVIPPGIHTFRLAYRATWVLGYFADHDELYWNVTGNGWVLPIDRATAQVRVEGLAANQIRGYGAYTGPMGARRQAYQSLVLHDHTHAPAAPGSAPSAGVQFTTTSPLGAGEGLTIYVSWPKGIVRPPTSAQRRVHWLADNWGWPVTVVGLLGVLAYFLFFLNREGRDPARQTIIPRFTPPSGLSAAAVRFLYRMGYDPLVLAVALLQSAVDGMVLIRQEKKTYTLQYTDDPQGRDRLTPDERLVMDQLFADRNRLELGRGYCPEVGRAAAELGRSLAQRYKGPNKLFVTNTGTFVGGMLLSGVVVGVGVVALATRALSPWLWGAVAVALGISNSVFHRLLKARTPTGRRVMDEIEGFRLYLNATEKDRLNWLNPPDETPTLFERYLPYALALGVEQRWAERFATVLAHTTDSQGQPYHPIWYFGPAWDSRYPARFGPAISSAFAGAVIAAATPPGSSAGAGGASGGGAGGGGGGGW